MIGSLATFVLPGSLPGKAHARATNESTTQSILGHVYSPLANPEGPCAGFTDTSQHNDYWCGALEYMKSVFAVDGYPGPTFRPDDAVTRGQFTKMLDKGFQWPVIGPFARHFQDVLPGSTFYDYIEYAYGRGLIVGYPCSTVSGSPEPCVAPTNYAYFRPANSVSRGQMAKMLAIAANFTDASPSTATFSDVQVGSTFFQYVERLVDHISTAPFPPDHPTQPSCTSGNPCFHPGTPASRSDLTEHVSLAYHFRSGIPVAGRAFSVSGSYLPAYDAVQVYMSAPTGDVGIGEIIGGPVGLAGGWVGNNHFIESGPERRYNGSTYENHPYGSGANDMWGVGGRDTSLSLTPGTSYRFQSYYATSANGHEWWSEIYDGSNWRRMATLTDVGVTKLPYLFAAAESTIASRSVGTLQVTTALAKTPGGSLSGWCWDASIVQRIMYAGYVSACLYSPTLGLYWSVNYTR